MTGKDDDWNTYETGYVIDLNEGETVYFRCPREKDDTLNKNKDGLCQYEEYDGEYYLNTYHFFRMEGSIKAAGNIQFLLEKTGTMMEVPAYCYYHLFRDFTNANGNTSLTQAPELPATTLANHCYSDMFNCCTSLTQAPELSATTLASGCYSYMFSDCTNIPEPKYNMSRMTFDEVTYKIQNNLIFGESGSYQVQCSDKILIAIFNKQNWKWTITEG